MSMPPPEEINAIMMPPQFQKVFSKVKGESHAAVAEALDESLEGAKFLVKSLMVRIEQLEKELKAIKNPEAKTPEAKKPEPKPVAKPTPKKASKK